MAYLSRMGWHRTLVTVRIAPTVTRTKTQNSGQRTKIWDLVIAGRLKLGQDMLETITKLLGLCTTR